MKRKLGSGIALPAVAVAVGAAGYGLYALSSTFVAPGASMAVYKQRFWIPGALAAILGGVLAAKAKTSIVKGVGLATSASGGFMLAESGTLLYTANKAAAASTSGSAPAQTTQGLYEPRGTGALLEPRGTGGVYEEIGYVTELDYLPAGG